MTYRTVSQVLNKCITLFLVIFQKSPSSYYLNFRTKVFNLYRSNTLSIPFLSCASPVSQSGDVLSMYSGTLELVLPRLPSLQSQSFLNLNSPEPLTTV